MSRRFQFSSVSRLLLIVGIAAYFLFAVVNWFVPGVISFVIGLIGLAGVVIGEAKSAVPVVRWRQFSLGAIFWLMFLLPAAAFTLGSSRSLVGDLIVLAVIVAASFVVKQIAGRIGRRPDAPQSDVHPLDS